MNIRSIKMDNKPEIGSVWITMMRYDDEYYITLNLKFHSTSKSWIDDVCL